MGPHNVAARHARRLLWYHAVKPPTFCSRTLGRERQLQLQVILLRVELGADRFYRKRFRKVVATALWAAFHRGDETAIPHQFQRSTDGGSA